MTDETMRCKRRNEVPSGMLAQLPAADVWKTQPDGTRTCSFCGSLHFEDAKDLLTRYVKGEEGVHFDPSTKDYKVYLHGPGVKNASEGGIKFYGMHLPEDKNDPALAEFNMLYGSAVTKHVAEMQRRYSGIEDV